MFDNLKKKSVAAREIVHMNFCEDLTYQFLSVKKQNHKKNIKTNPMKDLKRIKQLRFLFALAKYGVRVLSKRRALL